MPLCGVAAETLRILRCNKYSKQFSLNIGKIDLPYTGNMFKCCSTSIKRCSNPCHIKRADWVNVWRLLRILSQGGRKRSSWSPFQPFSSEMSWEVWCPEKCFVHSLFFSSAQQLPSHDSPTMCADTLIIIAVLPSGQYPSPCGIEED